MTGNGARSASEIAVVGPFPPFKGGIAQHTSRLAEGLDPYAAVRRVSWIDQYPRALYGRPQQDAEAVATADVAHILRWWDPTSWARAGKQISSADLAVLPWVSPVHALPYLTMMRFAPQTRFVLHVHNAHPHESIPFSDTLLVQALRRATGVICHGQSIADEVAELGVDVDIRVVSHPPDLDVEWTALPEGGPLELLFAGTIREYKGLDLLLEALAILGRDDTNLTIAGEVWNESARPSAEALARVPGRVVTEFGYVSDARLVEHLTASHALVAPYRSASQSGIVSLATAAGRPSLVTPVGSLAEAVEHGSNGVVASSVTPSAIAEGINYLSQNMGRMAAGTLESQCSWDDYAREVLAFSPDRATLEMVPSADL